MIIYSTHPRALRSGAAALLAICAMLAPAGLRAQAAAAQPAAPTAGTAPGAAAESIVLTLDEAVDLALRNNLGLKTERMRLEEKKWEKYSNWNVFLPKASVSAALSRSNLSDADRLQPDLSRFGEYAAAGFAGAFPTYAIPRWGAQFLLDLSFSLNAAQFVYVKQTALDYRMGLVTTGIAEKRLTRDVKKLYQSLLLLRESLGIFEQSYDLAERRLELARAREKIGSASELDVLAEEVNLEGVRPQIIEQRDSYDIALANLKFLLGIKRGVEVSLSGDLEPPTGEGKGPPVAGDEASLLGKLGSRLDLEYLRGAIESLRNKLAADVSGMTPSLFVRWTFDPTFQRDIMDSSTWSDASMSELWKQSSGALTFGLSLPLDPFIPRSRTSTDIKKSRMQVAEAELGYQGALEGAEIEVVTLLKRLDKSTKLISASEKSVALAERLYTAAEKAYGSGAKNYLELQDALGKLNGARFERLRAKHDYLEALGDLEYALTAGDFASR